MIPVAVLMWCLFSIWMTTSAVQYEDGKSDFTPAKTNILFFCNIFNDMYTRVVDIAISKLLSNI